jgi:hypothetical protein
MTDATAELSATSFGRRAAALLAASSDHLPRVLDVTVLGERHELLLEEVTGPTLGALLAGRRRLSPGEAVTTVIGAARAVAALHAAGYCGVSLAEDTLRFDGDGRPVVLGLDRLNETVLAGAQGMANDWRELAALADRLGLIAHGRAAGALGPAHVGLGLALATLTAGESEQSVDRLEEALFDLAEPEPVRLEVAGPAERAASPLTVRRHGAAHRRPSSSVLLEAFDAGPAALLAGPVADVRKRAGALLARLHGRARLLVIACGAAAALTCAAVVLLPDGASTRSAPTATPGTPSATADESAAATASPTPSADPELQADDPVAATPVLLARRDHCLTLSAREQAGCLADVADGQAFDLSRPARPLAGLAPSLLERSGDSALIALTPSDRKTQPASALLMRTEAGWRLRQLYEN